jgi:hypothetical protein
METDWQRDAHASGNATLEGATAGEIHPFTQTRNGDRTGGSMFDASRVFK